MSDVVTIPQESSPPHEKNDANSSSGTKHKESSPTAAMELLSVETLTAPLKKSPPKLKKKSVYVRFKAHFVKHLKESSIEVENDSNTAKEAWNKVRHLFHAPPTVTSSENEDPKQVHDIQLSRLYEFKEAAQQDEANDKAAHEEKLLNESKVHESVIKSTVETLVSTVNATWEPPTAETVKNESSSNIETVCSLVSEVVRIVEDSLKPWLAVWPDKVEKPSLESARQLSCKVAADRIDVTIFKKLKTASTLDLWNHAKMHRQAVLDQRKWKALEEKNQQAARIQHEKEQELVKNAKSIVPPQLAKQFHSMMKHDAFLKMHFHELIVDMDDICPAAFEAAFDLQQGVRQTTISSDDLGIGTKELRFGAILKCEDVTIALNGTSLMAKTKFTMHKPEKFGFLF